MPSVGDGTTGTKKTGGGMGGFSRDRIWKYAFAKGAPYRDDGEVAQDIN